MKKPEYAKGKQAVIAEAKARKSGGRVMSENHAAHIGGANRTISGGKGVHGMPLMSAASQKAK
jgi:hypothetical protein